MIEIVIASAVFILFATGIAQAVIGGFGSNRRAEELTIATQFASEGVEAMRSIRNQGYSNLVNTAGTGAAQSSGVWTFSGANNQYGPSNKYTRVLTVGDVQRDGSGNIVSSGGSVDPSSKKVISTVSWNSSSPLPETVVFGTYLTDYRSAASLLGNALVIYGDGSIIPKYRAFNTTTNAYSAESSAPSGSSGASYILRTSPTKTEAIAGYATSTGTLNILCYDGTNWSTEWSASVGGNANTRRFDIAYETSSGKAIVLYSTNASGSNEMAFRTKSSSSGCGAANWSAATNITPLRTSGIVQWIKMAWDRRSSSNLITAIWADNARDLSTAVWNGTSWANEPGAASETNVDVISGAQSDSEAFDVEYESLSGDVMFVWGTSVGPGTNGVRYRTCTGGTAVCTWGIVITPPTFVDDATNLDISANPNTDEIVFASIGRGQNDLQIGYWSGSTWTDTASADTSSNSPVAGSHLVSTGWLISGGTTRSIVVYADQGSNNIDWFVGNGATFTKQADAAAAPQPNNPNGYYSLQMNPLNTDQMMFNVSDGSNDLFGKRLVMTATPVFTWTNSDVTALEVTLPQSINSPFSFAYWRN